MKAERFFCLARRTVQERRASYGSAKEHFRRLAKRWSCILGCEVTPEQAVLCLIELKMARLRDNPGHFDSVIDIAGYAAVIAEMLSVDEMGESL